MFEVSRFAALVILSLLLPTSAASEWDDSFYPFLIDTNEPTSAFLVGEIYSRASLNLERAIDTYPQIDRIYLDSPGGEVHAALVLARIIDREGFETIIPSEKGCYSACAFLFFAGHSRYPFGELGVHQSDADKESNFGSQLSVADTIDILNDFDVTPEVYVRMFSTAPEDMYIFSSRELRKMGLFGSRRSEPDRNLTSPQVSPPSFDRYRREYGVDYFGQDLTENGIRDVTIEQCEAYCNEIAQCIAYTYVRDMDWCWPKYGVGQRRSNSRMISGQSEG